MFHTNYFYSSCFTLKLFVLCLEHAAALHRGKTFFSLLSNPDLLEKCLIAYIILQSKSHLVPKKLAIVSFMVNDIIIGSMNNVSDATFTILKIKNCTVKLMEFNSLAIQSNHLIYSFFKRILRFKNKLMVRLALNFPSLHSPLNQLMLKYNQEGDLSE